MLRASISTEVIKADEIAVGAIDAGLSVLAAGLIGKTQLALIVEAATAARRGIAWRCSAARVVLTRAVCRRAILANDPARSAENVGRSHIAEIVPTTATGAIRCIAKRRTTAAGAAGAAGRVAATAARCTAGAARIANAG